MKFLRNIFGSSNNSCKCEKEIAELRSEVNGFNNRVNSNTHNISLNRNELAEHSERLQINTSDIATLKQFHEVEPTPPERETINLDNVPNESYSYPTTYSNYLEPKINRYGNKVTRVSDYQEFGTTSQRLGHDYSQVQAWNSDETLIKLAQKPAFILDANTYEVVAEVNQQGNPRWSNTKPHIIYGVSGNTFVELDVRTNQRNTLHTFTGYSRVYLTGQGNLSNDDRYVLLIGEKSSGKYLIKYDVSNNVVSKQKSYNLSNIDWVSISPKGDYALLQFKTSGTGTSQGVWRLDANLENPTLLTYCNQHNDYGIDADGSQIILHQRLNDDIETGHALMKTNIETGEQTPIFEWHANDHNGEWGIYGSHISLRGQNGWALISEGCCPTHPCLPREIFAIKLDGSNEIIRIAKHHTKEGYGYGHEAQVSVNRSFTKAIFKSNEGNAQYQGFGGAHAFIVEF